MAEDRKWIQKAIKKPGGLHQCMHVPQGEKLDPKGVDAMAKKKGKCGQRARLARTLRDLHK